MAHERTLDELQKAIRAHGLWALRLKTAVTSGNSDVTPEIVARDNLCEFGKWLHDDSMPEAMKEGMPYKVITRLHSEFHLTAASVLRDAMGGNTAKARELLEGDFSEQSKKLMRALSKWKTELRNS